jgi:hypothetical protein
MSKQRKRNRETKQTQPRPQSRGFLFVAIGVGVLALAVLALLGGKGLWGNTNPAISQSATNLAGAVAESKPSFSKLLGKWVRPDGGYVMEIKNADENGKLEVGYFNPNPIHVARAEASGQGSMIKVFVELRDVNYPGSTYTLIYDSAADQLRGIYFQAVEKQQFEVQFVRTR